MLTDEQLNRLRNELDHTDNYGTLKALLARLDAAEKVCEEVEKKATGFYWRGALEAWKKSKGDPSAKS